MAKKELGGEAGKASKKNFEASLERLEAIVGDMEGGKLGLDDMIARFEEGQSLVKFCSGKLNEVEKRIEVLVKKGDGVTAVPLEEGPPDVVEAPPAAGGGMGDDADPRGPELF